MIFIGRSLVMLSIPKTGTHSYIDHLQGQAGIIFKHPQNLKHMGLRQFTNRILPLVPELAGELDYFAFIRHPADWLWSWYCYRSREGIKNRPASTMGMSFSEFIRGYLADTPPPYANVGRQSSLLTSPAPPFSVNNLYRYDNGDAANIYLSEKLRICVSPKKRLNQSPLLPKEISRADMTLLETNLPTEFELYESAH